MNGLWEIDALKLYAITSTILALQLIAVALWTGTVRVMRKQYVNQEDKSVIKGVQAEAEHPDVARVKRAHMNLIENALPFFVIGLLYALTNPTVFGAQAYFFTFVGARILHTLFYLWGRQPFRTICFAVGVLVCIGMGVHVLRFAFAA